MDTRGRQQAAEAELRKLVSRLPDSTREGWTQRDYVNEMDQSLKWIHTSSGMEGFFRRQKLIKIPPRAPSAKESVIQHAPYVERTLDTAADDLRREWLPVVGTLKLQLIHKSRLNICTEYQRNSIIPAKVDKIAAAMDLIAFGALTVGKRGEDHYIVDGQNRWMASQRRPELGELNCLVFQSLGVEHEARIFAAININRTGVTAVDKYRAMLTGGDPIAVKVSEALTTLGIEVVNRGANGPNQLSAIQFVYNMAARDITRCEIILSQVQSITPGSPIVGELLRALDYLDQRIDRGVQNPTLCARLRKIGVHKLMDAILQSRLVGNGPRQLGQTVLGEVNKGLSENRRVVLLEV